MLGAGPWRAAVPSPHPGPEVYVRHLQLVEFRSWAKVDLALRPGPTVFVGRNGEGKTNLVEAVGYLATMGSHRVSGDAPLVRQGASQAVVRAALRREDRELLVEIEINPGRANRVRVNRAPLPRPRELLGLVKSVLFAPEDLVLVRGDPAERRRFLDDLLVSRTPRLAGVRSDYDRVLKQRNALLKTARMARGDALATLDVWDGHLVDLGGQLLAARLRLVADLAPHVARAYAGVAGAGAVVAALGYASTVPLAGDGTPVPEGTPLPTAEELSAARRERVAERRGDEVDRGMTLVGPHRDDLVISLGSLPAKGFASHGESWTPTAGRPWPRWRAPRSSPWSPRRCSTTSRRSCATRWCRSPAGRRYRSGPAPPRMPRTARCGRRSHERGAAGAAERHRPRGTGGGARGVGVPAPAHPAADRRPEADLERAPPGGRRPPAAGPAGGQPRQDPGLDRAHEGRHRLRPVVGTGRPRHRRPLHATDPHRGRVAGGRGVHRVGHPAAAAGPDDPRQTARVGRRGRRDPVARCRSDGPELEEGPPLGPRPRTAGHVRIGAARRGAPGGRLTWRRGSDEQPARPRRLRAAPRRRQRLARARPPRRGRRFPRAAPRGTNPRAAAPPPPGRPPPRGGGPRGPRAGGRRPRRGGAPRPRPRHEGPPPRRRDARPLRHARPGGLRRPVRLRALRGAGVRRDRRPGARRPPAAAAVAGPLLEAPHRRAGAGPQRRPGLRHPLGPAGPPGRPGRPRAGRGRHGARAAAGQRRRGRVLDGGRLPGGDPSRRAPPAADRAPRPPADRHHQRPGPRPLSRRPPGEHHARG